MLEYYFITKPVTMIQYSPVADPSMLNTCTVTFIDDGLLRTSTGSASPPSSLTLYVLCSKLTVPTIDVLFVHTIIYYSTNLVKPKIKEII